MSKREIHEIEYLQLCWYRDNFQTLAKRNQEARSALEELASEVRNAVNWEAAAKEKVGSAPWIDQDDAFGVDEAIIKANSVLGTRSPGDEEIER